MFTLPAQAARGGRGQLWLSPLVGVLLLALFAPGLRAQVPVEDCSEDALLMAIDVAAGTDEPVVFTEDCTITLSAPISIYANTTIDAQGHKVVLSGNDEVRLFEVQPDEVEEPEEKIALTLAGLTLRGGMSDKGGAIFINTNGVAFLTNCVLAGNAALGYNGVAGAKGANSALGNGGNGGNGTAGTGAMGGAIYNKGELTLLHCTLTTNSVAGGHGGNGGNGGNGAFNGGNGGNGGMGGAALGGGIYNAGVLALTNCTLYGQQVVGGDGGLGGTNGLGGSPSADGLLGSGGVGGAGSGAGIYSTRCVAVVNCTFSSNLAQSGSSAAGGSLVNGNGANGPNGTASSGGGIYLAGVQVGNLVLNSTFYGNKVTGGAGGAGGPGVFNGGAGGAGGNGLGGGLCAAGTVAITNSTFANCAAKGGAGGAGGPGFPSGSAGSAGINGGGGLAQNGGTSLLCSSLFSTNTPGASLYLASGKITDTGFNLSSDSSALLTHKTSQKGKNPKLGALADNGGPTLTMALLGTASPAYGKVTNDSCHPLWDQRGITRHSPGKAGADIGAYEIAPPFIAADQPHFNYPTNGGSVTFTVSAIGDPPLQYQWRRDGTNLTGGTKSSYTVASLTNEIRGPYSVQVTSAFGSNTSAEVTVNFAPGILVAPTNQTVSFGDSTSFSVKASGDPALHYQWFFNGTNLLAEGPAASTLSVAGAQSADAGTYTVAITNGYGAITSAPVTLAVNIPPTITQEPKSLAALVGGTATFSVSALGTPPLTYQWHFNGTNIPVVNAPTYTISKVQAGDAGTYSVTVSSAVGKVESDTATLSVYHPFTIHSQPKSLSVVQGQDAAFSVGATGEALSYQWTFQGRDLAGATGPSYTVHGARASDAGAYAVKVSNPAVVSNSAPALLQVQVALQQPRVQSNIFSFRFDTATNSTYVVQYKTNLNDPAWLPCSTNAGTGSWLTNRDGTTNSPSRFYRIQVR